MSEREAEGRIPVAARIELSPVEQSPRVMNYQFKQQKKLRKEEEEEEER